MRSELSTCGIEGKLPKHMLIEEGEQRCYDGRPCPYKVLVEPAGMVKMDVCSYSSSKANKEVKQ